MNITTFPLSNILNIGITLGDPAGIGAEVVLKALQKTEIPRGKRILLIGDYLQLDCPGIGKDVFRYDNITKWRRDSSKLGILDLGILKNYSSIRYGKGLPEYGKAAYKYLLQAIELIKKNDIQALITGPVNKKVINSAGHKFLGHTEFLKDFFNVKKVIMMLFSDKYKFILLTRHVPLKEVSALISPELIIETVRLTYKTVKKIFVLDDVKMGIVGLNPHLGDGGLIGEEEEKVIIPTVKELKKNYHIKGPIPLFKLIKQMEKKEIDIVICMYHNQAIDSLKLLCPESGVNLTLGLPFIRTSPVHGTAYEIAGKNKASGKSMAEALKFTVSL